MSERIYIAYIWLDDVRPFGGGIHAVHDYDCYVVVVSAGAAPQFVEEDEAALGDIVQDIGSLAHLHHERALAYRYIIARAHAREDLIHPTDAGPLSRHKAPHLRH